MGASAIMSGRGGARHNISLLVLSLSCPPTARLLAHSPFCTHLVSPPVASHSNGHRQRRPRAFPRLLRQIRHARGVRLQPHSSPTTRRRLCPRAASATHVWHEEDYPQGDEGVREHRI